MISDFVTTHLFGLLDYSCREFVTERVIPLYSIKETISRRNLLCWKRANNK